MTNQPNAAGHTAEIAAAVQAERERCLAIIDRKRRRQKGLMRVATLHIRTRIESGETP